MGMQAVSQDRNEADMNSRYWEAAPPTKAPIMWYLVYSGRISVFQKEKVIAHLPTLERLPFTHTALVNRYARGADVPPQWKAQVFEIAEAA